MREKAIKFESLLLQFSIKEESWQLSLPKSQTQIKDQLQLGLLTETANFFVPVEIVEKEDVFDFLFTVNSRLKKWENVKELNRNDKLRLLSNVARLQECLSTRMTFFLHPDNLVFDDNLMPYIIYRGIRNLVPPYEMDEEQFLKQFKCLTIALFSNKYSFDELYSGSLQHVDAKGTEFERQVSGINDLAHLIKFVEENYQREQKKTDETMQLVPIKQFRLFKQLAIMMMILSVILAVPLAYFFFVNLPHQEKLLTAHREHLASDYGKVISTLRGEDPEKLPNAAKYILAHSYVKVEKLSDAEKDVIMKNISLKSDQDYLLYWIHNGLGNFEESIDLAKYIDDPQLIMYGLIKKIEQDKNNPNLSGSEREEIVNKSQEELAKYREQYDLAPEEDDSALDSVEGTVGNEQEQDDSEFKETQNEKDEKKLEEKDKQKDKVKKSNKSNKE